MQEDARRHVTTLEILVAEVEGETNADISHVATHYLVLASWWLVVRHQCVMVCLSSGLLNRRAWRVESVEIA